MLLLLSSLLSVVQGDCSGAPPATAWSICKNCSELPEYLLLCDDVLDLSSKYNESAAKEFREKYRMLDPTTTVWFMLVTIPPP